MTYGLDSCGPWFRAILVVLATAFISGCDSNRSVDLQRGGTPVYVDSMSDETRTQASNMISQAVVRGTENYRLHPGDTVEVMFKSSHQPTREAYRIHPGDELEVQFLYQPTMTHSYLVRPDGRISLPGHGVINAANQTPEGLAKTLTALYSAEYVQPDVSVNPTRIVTATDDLLATLTSSSGTRTQTVVLAPDGNVTFPMLRSINANGSTVDQLTDEANLAYSERYGNIMTSVRLGGLASQQVFVFGEVPRPGPVLNERPRTVLQLLASAGGALPTGSLENIRVMYWDDQGQPHIRTVNIQNVMEKLALEEDMIVPPNSVIYVPPTALTKFARFMDQLLRQAFQYNGTGFALNYNINGISGLH
jgi:protein involved in polysaccharide export with SLBB domain